MTCKTVEIRDRGTFVPALAIRLDPACEEDRWLLARAGYGRTKEDQEVYVLLIKLTDAPFDAFKHGNRTMQTAHLRLCEEFDRIESGQVLDVEYILGETPTPKISERFTHGQNL